MHHLIFSILDCCPFEQPIFEAQHGPTHLYTSFIFTFPELSSFPTKNSAFDLSNSLPLRALCYSIWSLGTTTMLQEIVVAFCSQQLMVLSVVSGVALVYQQMSWDIEYLEKNWLLSSNPFVIRIQYWRWTTKMIWRFKNKNSIAMQTAGEIMTRAVHL